jgi:hypothetical protein
MGYYNLYVVQSNETTSNSPQAHLFNAANEFIGVIGEYNTGNRSFFETAYYCPLLRLPTQHNTMSDRYYMSEAVLERRRRSWFDLVGRLAISTPTCVTCPVSGACPQSPNFSGKE